MADPLTITSIVLSAVALSASIFTPIIISLAYFIKNIHHSQCCMISEVDLNSPENAVPVKEKVLLPKLLETDRLNL